MFSNPGKNKKIIWELITSINLGGAENVAFNLAENISEDLELLIVELFETNSPYGIAKRKELLSKHIRFLTLIKASKGLSLIFAPLKLFYLIKKKRPDIIHSHTDLPDFVLAIALKFLFLFRIPRPKIIRTIHNTELWPTHNQIGKFVENSFNDDQIVAVSAASIVAYKKLRVSNNLNISDSTCIVYNACKIREKESINISLNEEKINILFCGRFEAQKGIDMLIEAIETINIKHSNCIEFYFIGDGSYLEQLQRLSEKWKNINIHSPIINISSKIHAFDFVIIPSRFEGFGLISLEATLARVPVIASKIEGLSETLPDSWPLLFNPNDIQSLLIILEGIINNKYDLESLVEEGFLFVSDKFSFTRMINSYFDLYRSL